MLTLPSIEPIDYLVIGHLTKDLTPKGPQLGGTAAYAALTAKALGLRVGIVTAVGPDVSLAPLEGIQIASLPVEQSTTFENIYTPQGRIQYLYNKGPDLGYHIIPEIWRHAPIVHLGPLDQEVEPSLVREFPDSLVGITPQGWLRTWDKENRVHLCEWPEANYMLSQASAAVLSLEDLANDEKRVEEMVPSSRVLVVTEGAAGSRLFWNGDVRRFRPPQVTEVDPVGAGDIFAAAFFYRLSTTRDPWEAARFATILAANSVTRPGLLGVPTDDEVRASLIQVV
jgi:sugar/nucleoside kinase (ribokinase family)